MSRFLPAEILSICMNSSIFDSLNDQQKQAVLCAHGPSIVLAGAGSGKTRVLTQKVLHLVNDLGVDSSHIAMMTFTNKAAREMQERVPFTLGFIGTFHSLCARILRRDAPHIGLSNDFVIYDEDDAISLLKKIMKGVVFRKKVTPSMIKYRISSAKDQLIGPQRFASMVANEYDEAVATIYMKYQQRLVENNAVDFDDLIFKTVLLFKEHPEVLARYNNQFTHILVDEFQDTNTAQYVLARMLAQKDKNITVVHGEALIFIISKKLNMIFQVQRFFIWSKIIGQRKRFWILPMMSSIRRMRTRCLSFLRIMRQGRILVFSN